MILLSAAALAGTDVLLSVPVARTSPVRLDVPDPDPWIISNRTPPDRYQLAGGFRVVRELWQAGPFEVTVDSGLDGWMGAWEAVPMPMSLSMWTVPVEPGFRILLDEASESGERRAVYFKGAVGPSMTLAWPDWWERYLGVGLGTHAGFGVSVPVGARRVVFEGRTEGQLYLSGYSGTLAVPDGTVSIWYYPGKLALTALLGVSL